MQLPKLQVLAEAGAVRNIEVNHDDTAHGWTVQIAYASRQGERCALASVVGARYLAIGTGDTERYIFAGMLAAVVISLRVFLFRGAGKAN